MRVQFDTDGCEIPSCLASSLTPPAARIASSSPGSRIVLTAFSRMSLDGRSFSSERLKRVSAPPKKRSIVSGYAVRNAASEMLARQRTSVPLTKFRVTQFGVGLPVFLQRVIFLVALRSVAFRLYGRALVF